MTEAAEEKPPDSSIWRWPKADKRKRMRLSNYTLSPTRINNAKAKDKLYKLSDGGGLFVEVSPAGQKTWRYQYRFGGSRRDVKVGRYPEVGVADARERHFELRASHGPGGPRRSRRNDIALKGERQRRDDRKSIGASPQRCAATVVRARLRAWSGNRRRQW